MKQEHNTTAPKKTKSPKRFLILNTQNGEIKDSSSRVYTNYLAAYSDNLCTPFKNKNGTINDKYIYIPVSEDNLDLVSLCINLIRKANIMNQVDHGKNKDITTLRKRVKVLETINRSAILTLQVGIEDV